MTLRAGLFLPCIAARVPSLSNSSRIEARCILGNQVFEMSGYERR